MEKIDSRNRNFLSKVSFYFTISREDTRRSIGKNWIPGNFLRLLKWIRNDKERGPRGKT